MPGVALTCDPVVFSWQLKRADGEVAGLDVVPLVAKRLMVRLFFFFLISAILILLVISRVASRFRFTRSEKVR